MPPARSAVRQEDQERAVEALLYWRDHPVSYVENVMGATPDPWQCDVFDALMEHDNVALTACHGVGKTALEAWAIIWFTTTRMLANVPSTAPTFNKQVKDVLWKEINLWWEVAQRTSPWMTADFVCGGTRLYNKVHPKTWFSVGIASSQPLNIEGYHAPYLLAVFDEAKAIPGRTWESVQGMRTTQDAKLLVASTPGGPRGEFYKVFTKYRETWKATFIVHPQQLRDHPRIRQSTARPGPAGGRYFSARVRDEWIAERRVEWGDDSPVFIARALGDFPTLEGDVLIPYAWLSDAEGIEDGIEGPKVVACDVARYGRDRTIILVMNGGTLEYAESISRVPEESSSPEVEEFGTGDDTQRPIYRSTVVTALACARIRKETDAEVIAIDDTGLGGGVTDVLRHMGERVIPINFGTAPTDRPKDQAQREQRQRRNLLDSAFSNLKAQMGWALRSGFEQHHIGLGKLACRKAGEERFFLEALVAQTSMVKQEFDAMGRIRIVDPDEDASEEEYKTTIGDLEGKRSPDHFHALMIGWWVAGRAAPWVTPKAGQPHTPGKVPLALRLGHPTRVGQMQVGGPPPRGGGVAARLGRTTVSGHMARLGRMYR